MSKSNCIKRAALGTCLAAMIAAGMASAVASPAIAQSPAEQAAHDVTLSVGTGPLVSLDGTMSDVFFAHYAIADVPLPSPHQTYIFAQGPRPTTVFPTNPPGSDVRNAASRE